MENIFTYISAIKNESSNELIIERSFSDQSYEEDGILIESSELMVAFVNGVIVKQCIEIDSCVANEIVKSDMVCDECWISYQVVSEPDELNVLPKRKHFINKCQESFWLKINTELLVRDSFNNTIITRL